MSENSHPFEILEHTADIGIRAEGDTLEQVFVRAGIALQSLAFENERVEAQQLYRVTASGEDPESLLVNWLNEVIYLLDGERILLARIEIKGMDDCSMTAECWGEEFNPERHRVRLTVKAATYHQLHIAFKDGRWIAEVYLDI